MRASLWARTTLSISLTRVGEPRRPSASRSAASASWSHWTTRGAAHGLAVAPDHAHLGLVALRVQVAVVVLGHGLGGDALVGHDQLDARRAGIVGLAGDGEQARQRARERLEAALDAARGGDCAGAGFAVCRRRRQLVDPADAGDLRVAQLLGRLRAHLRRVAVDRLAAAEHEVRAAELLDGQRERVARGQRVGAGERLVGEQDDLVGAAVQRLAQHLHGGRRPHRQHGDAGVVTVLELERLFQRVQVLGVEHGRQRRPVDGAVLFHGLAGHVGRVRDLLDEDDDAQLRHVRRPGSGDWE